MANNVQNLNQPKPKTDDAKPEKPEAAKTGAGLLEYLTVTGSGPVRLKRIGGFLHDNPKISAEELYREMEEAEPAFSMATLRKACKFAFGDEAEPATLTQSNPQDEVTRLRGENETLRRGIADRDARNAMLTKQLEIERNKTADNLRTLAMNGGNNLQTIR